MHSMPFKPLTHEDLDEIFNKHVKQKCHVSCDEYHAHGFNCAVFTTEEVMVLERLRVEVSILLDKLEEIKKLTTR